MCVAAILKPVAIIPRSNMTAEEEFRLTGTLCPSTIESVLDEAARFEGQDEALSGIKVKIEEARGCFPAEDVLAPVTADLNKLLANVRGANKVALAAIIESLEQISTEMTQSSEYGQAELNDALKLIKD